MIRCVVKYKKRMNAIILLKSGLILLSVKYKSKFFSKYSKFKSEDNICISTYHHLSPEYHE